MTKQLPAIANHLMLYTSSMPDPGLCRGKMGSVLFFIHYANYTGNHIYDDFAGEILDEIYEDITLKTPIYFSNGLCGIAWGIEYLLQQGYMEGQSDEILSELDERVMKQDPRRITDFTLETGLEGIAWYVLSRLTSPRSSGYPFDDRYLNDLKLACHNSELTNNKPNGIFALSQYLEHQKTVYSFSEILNIILCAYSRKHKIKEWWQQGIKLITK